MFGLQYLQTTDNDAGLTIFSPWFPRQSDKIWCTLEIADAINADFSVNVFHKNHEDTGDGSDAGPGTGGLLNLNAAGRNESEFDGIKEMVRYQFVLKSQDGNHAAVLFRMLANVWFDSVSTT